MIDGIISRVNYSAPIVEKGFNIAGSIPVLGALGSLARISASKVQVVAGFCFALLGTLGYVGASLVGANGSTKRSCARLFGFGVQHVGHGILNMGRGYTELASQVLTLGIATLVFNMCKNPIFSPVVSY